MSHRAEEKEARRQARLEQEAKAAKAAARKGRLRFLAAAVLGVAVIAAVVLAIVAGAGDNGDGPAEAGEGDTAPIPAQQIADLAAAAEAAGCEVVDAEAEGSNHTTETVTYEANPPHSGDHNPEAAQDGVYAPGSPPPVENTVHALEHGRINFQYKPGTEERRISQLETLVAEKGGYHQLLYENQTGMDAAVAATAWTHQLTCPQWNDKVWDALRAFRDRWTDQGPEQVP